jgi:outer membrane protein assembly factor BamB
MKQPYLVTGTFFAGKVSGQCPRSNHAFCQRAGMHSDARPAGGANGAFRLVATMLVAGVLVILAACSKDKDIDQPVPLTLFNATLRTDKVWTAEVADKGAKPLRLGLGLSVGDGHVYAAGHKGEVAAFDLQTGRSLWRVKTKLALSGGPGAGGGLVIIGSTFGDLVALNAADGATRWKIRLNGEVLSAPAVSERLIAVRTVDGKLRGLSPKDGHELWSAEQQVPRLSLRGTSYPIVAGDLVLSGFDNGKVAAVNINDGSVQWETTIAPPHGKTEIERLDDVDSAVRVSGSDVYAIGFQGRIAMLALDTGQIWWSHDASSFRGLGLDEESLFISTADGEIVALRRRTGTELWRQKALLHRRLSAAVEGDTTVVTADFQGYVHWLDKATGALAARARTGKVRISNAPVVAGNMVLVVNDAGHITAFRTNPIAGARPSTPAAAGTTASPTTPAAATPSDKAIQGAASDSDSPAPPASPAPQDDHASSVPAPEPAPQPTPPPASPSDQGAPVPTPPERGPTPAAPGTTEPPLPSQPTPDPLPPQPQTQPQPPPS